MRILRILFLTICMSVLFTSCEKKTEKVDKQEQVLAAKMERISLHVSGMTCEIGCAKTIQSKLSKKEGISSAKVIFTDSIASIDFDANKISKDEIITFIDGIAGGDLYKASEIGEKK